MAFQVRDDEVTCSSNTINIYIIFGPKFTSIYFLEYEGIINLLSRSTMPKPPCVIEKVYN
jgi:hypothetical protein